NEVSFNRINDFSHMFSDNAGIYTLSAQPGLRVHDNYISAGNKGFGCLYPDEGSAYGTWTNNVCRSVRQWLHLWTTAIHDNTITDNYTDTPAMQNDGTNNPVTGNTVVTGDWPEPALRIINAAGLLRTTTQP